MRIVSWNVNGIRACLEKGLEKVVHEMDADFFCLQESKAHPDQVEMPSYPKLHALSSTWASAVKKGYSGTVTFTPHKQTVELRPTMGIELYDQEGRANVAFAKGFTLVNLYIPNGAASDERHLFKMRFLDELLPWLKKLEKERGPLVICGDYNIAHTEIDIHDPVRNQDSSGFRPEERAWMTKFLSHGFVDTFRLLHPGQKDQYSWWSFRQRSRERNKGWRIDYICVSQALEGKIRRAEIHPEIKGSDHCPISLELAL
jgi:exodeoxyribonuclease III